MEGDADPVLDEEQDQPVEREDNHPQNETPVVSAGRVIAKEDKHTYHAHIQIRRDLLANRIGLGSEGINDLRYSQAEYESPVAAVERGDGNDGGKSGDPIKPTGTRSELRLQLRLGHG